MHLQTSIGSNRISFARRGGASLGLLLALGFGSSAVQAQELTHRFINPSFGGNPFNSEHLLGIANIHRPDEPESDTPGATPEDGIASAIRTRFLGQLQGQIISRIENAKPGESGEFSFGNQRVSFTKTTTETRVTLLNTTTGESQLIVVPVPGSSPSANTSAEQALGASGSKAGPLSSGPSSSLLDFK